MNFEHNTINHEIELVSGVYRFKSLIWGAGRTGRMNQSGRVFLIINNKDKSHVKGLPKVLDVC